MSNDDQFPDDRWDSALAAALPGKFVLVGLNCFSAGGELIEQKQLFGRVDAVDERQGIRLRLEGISAGEFYNLPPDTRPFRAPAPGEYRLRSTGETVLNPDFIAEWSIYDKKSD